MSQYRYSVTFTIIQYNIEGDQSIVSSISPGDEISGEMRFFPNVGGGEASVSFQFMNGPNTVGTPIAVTIRKPGEPASIKAPSGCDRFEMTFANVTFPAGQVTISVSSS